MRGDGCGKALVDDSCREEVVSRLGGDVVRLGYGCGYVRCLYWDSSGLGLQFTRFLEAVGSLGLR